MGQKIASHIHCKTFTTLISQGVNYKNHQFIYHENGLLTCNMFVCEMFQPHSVSPLTFDYFLSTVLCFITRFEMEVFIIYPTIFFVFLLLFLNLEEAITRMDENTKLIASNSSLQSQQQSSPHVLQRQKQGR